MKKILSFLSLCLVAVLVSFTSLNNKKLIVIDAGHGGIDHGATFEELHEKDIVEQISKKIFEKHDPSTVELVLLRDTDNNIELTDRIKRINELNPDLVISLHANFNSFKKNQSGIEAYVSENNSHHHASTEEARKLLEAVSNDNLKSRGVKHANFLILRKSNCPIVLLELGFLSDENDRKYLSSEKGQNEIAANILKSIQ